MQIYLSKLWSFAWFGAKLDQCAPRPKQREAMNKCAGELRASHKVKHNSIARCAVVVVASWSKTSRFDGCNF